APSPVRSPRSTRSSLHDDPMLRICFNANASRSRGVAPVTPAVTVDREGTVTGNTYDKYGSTNPVVRRLMAGFESTLDELFRAAAPGSLLDVGCGEGVLTQQWAARIDGRVVGIDLDDPHLHGEWTQRQAPNPPYRR